MGCTGVEYEPGEIIDYTPSLLYQDIFFIEATKEEVDKYLMKMKSQKRTRIAYNTLLFMWALVVIMLSCSIIKIREIPPRVTLPEYVMANQLNAYLYLIWFLNVATIVIAFIFFNSKCIKKRTIVERGALFILLATPIFFLLLKSDLFS